LRIIQKSKLFDEKWGRKDYQNRTIEAALKLVKKTKANDTTTAISIFSEDELLKMKIPENPRFKTNLESNNFIQEYIR